MSKTPGAEAAERAGLIAKQADVVAALTLEVLKGTSRFKLLVINKMISPLLKELLNSFNNLQSF